jgi:hypothetical protein
MAGLVPAIHNPCPDLCNMDGRHKAGHDDVKNEVKNFAASRLRVKFFFRGFNPMRWLSVSTANLLTAVKVKFPFPH